MSSDLLSLATFKSTTPTCFHWCFQWRKAISNVNYSQLLAFCLFLIKPPLTTKMHQPALAGTCVQHLNPKFKTFNVCCMLCKLTQPTSVYFQFTNCIFATSAAFSTFFCISRDVHYIHLADPGEKGKTNHQPSKDATLFLPHQVVRPWGCLLIL